MKTYYDIEGDGGSRILEQVVEHQARIRDRLAGVRSMVAIGSGKGGVGKSTLTLQLATVLQRAGQRCAVLDADLNGPSQARLAGLGSAPLVPARDGRLALPRNREGLGVFSLGSLVPESEAVDFPSVARGDSHVWRATREFALLGQLLGAVEWGALDLLLVDLPPGAERTFQYAEFLGPRAAFVLVTLPTDLARGVVARSLAALRKTKSPILGYIENMKGYYCPDCRSVRPLFAEAATEEAGGTGATLDAPLLGSVPFDAELQRCGDRGESFAAAGDRPALRALREIGAQLQSRLALLTTPSEV